MHYSLSTAVPLSIKEVAKAKQKLGNEAEQDSKQCEDLIGGKKGEERLQEMFLQVVVSRESVCMHKHCTLNANVATKY